MKAALHALASALALLLCACAQKPPVPAAVSDARAAAARGAQAFSRGELGGARREYLEALRIHDSLGDTQGRASALLSLSRVAAEAGRPEEALSAVGQVLADGALLDTPVRVTAHGRAAALQLAQGRLAEADEQLALAGALCGGARSGACADAGALAVLRARAALARREPAQALKLAGEALALPQLAGVEPPTLRPQASAARANALRVQAQALAALGQPRAVPAPAAAALDIDRALGLAGRVLADLQLLADAYEAQGDPALARQYRTLADRAAAAGQAARGAKAE